MEGRDVKTCIECGECKPLSEFHRKKAAKDGLQPKCKKCHYANNSRYIRENPVLHRSHKLKSRYGITGADYADMLVKQGGRCAICHEPCQPDTNLAVDHNHATGQVRGLLCRGCNTGIGLLRDDPEVVRKAADYLETRRGPETT